jgi:riboflavin synthase
MFTGLVEGKAKLVAVVPMVAGLRFSFEFPSNMHDVTMGESIALNGCCLTVIAIAGNLLSFEAGKETLSKTNLGKLVEGSDVNFERSLRAGDRLGGHFVTGHIDGQGQVVRRSDEGDWSDFEFSAPPALLRQMASKGSIAVDGVSLTLVQVTDQSFSVALIPHTLQATTLGQRRVGDAVNLETDILAKYVQRANDSFRSES